MSALSKFILATPEPKPAGLPEPSGRGLSEEDLAALRAIYQTTIEQAHALHKCDSSEQARRWADFLNQHLPDDRECFVIRGREVNCYTHN
jgi:hypothetical protein